MTAKSDLSVPPVERITIDDLKHRAESVKSKAISEAKGAVDVVVGQEATRTLLIVAGIVVVAASLAFFLGSRAGRDAMAEQFPGE